VGSKDFYSKKAQEMRDQAARAGSRRASDKFLQLALEYEDLAAVAPQSDTDQSKSDEGA
jgi:hypothetical protein